ncbi:epimerase [Streptomyces sp. DSM 44915]|uniref:Epimerase n=1 Tax=Streptomyces chisholmiae TaxID=3075540 RepID=A0ABU2JW32_9ACTN|nr:epimerase [Streptomyces sp. DSM 44915]MDT0269077.1 epimerase [Streptomyces sp. DSM 44915]
MRVKVVVFGPSGLIGDGFVRESLRAEDVTEVVTVGRGPLAATHPKHRHLVHGDFLDFDALSGELAGVDACFWALGVTSMGMSPADYERVTHDYTVAAVRTLAAVNPGLTFVYLSGAGTDGTERGRSRWARVKGRTENAVIGAFPRGYALRPAFVLPAHAKRSKTRVYRWGTAAVIPFAPLLRRLSGAAVTDTAQLGRVGLHLARHGHERRVWENRDIVALATADPGA